MKNNFENPLLFFEYVVNEDNIYAEIDKVIYYYDFASYGINLPNEIKYVEQNEYGEYDEGIIKVQDILIPILRREFENSKKIILDKFLNNNQEYNKNFLLYLFNSLQSLIHNNTKIINRYPFLLLPIRGIVKFINDKLLLPNTDKFMLNEDGIVYNPINEYSSIEKTNEDKIHSILQYMKGKNEKQKIILTESDYNLLIQYTTHLIEKEEVPVISKQLEPDVTNDTIRFTYWALHKELYTTKQIRTYFYEFIKAVFTKFKDSEIKSIKSQFGTKSRVYKHTFLPFEIAQHL